MQPIRKSIVVAWFACAILFSSVSAAPPRLWTDSSGTFTVTAELVEVKDGNVRLKKQDGTEIIVAVSNLSVADRNYVAATGAPAPPSPAAVPAGRSLADLEPQESIVVVEIEEDGKLARARPGMVIAVDGPTAYVGVSHAVYPRRRGELYSTPPPETHYFGRVGKAGAERRAELRPIVVLADRSYAILAGPSDVLPAPPIATSERLPEVLEGTMLTFAGVRPPGAAFEGLAFKTKEFERVREPIKVARMSQGLGSSVNMFHLEGRGGFGYLVDAKNTPLAFCDGEPYKNFAVPLETRFGRNLIDFEAMRVRVSWPTDDEVVVEFAARTIDPFQAGWKPQLLVAHPEKSKLQKPHYELLGGESEFFIRNGKWLRPDEGTVVEMRLQERLDPAFEMSPAPDAWCRSATWYGTYRFKPSLHPKTVWYYPTFVNAEGRYSKAARIRSHVFFPKAVGTAIRYEHPVYQYDQGVPVDMPVVP